MYGLYQEASARSTGTSLLTTATKEGRVPRRVSEGFLLPGAILVDFKISIGFHEVLDSKLTFYLDFI